jgi:hypothetical protein
MAHSAARGKSPPTFVSQAGVPTVIMWRAVKNHQIVVITDLQGLLKRTEAFDGDNRFQPMLKPLRLPVEACALGDVEVGDLDIPACRCVFTCS